MAPQQGRHLVETYVVVVVALAVTVRMGHPATWLAVVLIWAGVIGPAWYWSREPETDED